MIKSLAALLLLLPLAASAAPPQTICDPVSGDCAGVTEDGKLKVDAVVNTGDLTIESADGAIVDGVNANLKATVTAGNALKVDASATTQPVSGPLTNTQLRASPFDINAIQSGPWTVAVGAGLPAGSNQIGHVITDPTSVSTIYGVAKGATTSSSATVTATGADHNSLDVILRDANGDPVTALGGGLTDSELRATPVEVAIMSGGGTGGTASDFAAAFPASGTAMGAKNSAGTAMEPLTLDALGQLKVVLPAGGTGLTDTELRATPVPVSGTVTITPSGTQAVSGTFWQATQPVSIASMPSTPVTGTFWQATQPVSAASLPLPTGAATEATLVAASAKLPAALNAGGSLKTTLYNSSGVEITSNGNGQATMANSTPVVIASDQSAVPVSAGLRGLTTTSTGLVTATTLTQIVALSGSNKTYIKNWKCSSSAASTTTTDQQCTLKYGTGSNCGTGTTYADDCFQGANGGCNGQEIVIPAGQAVCWVHAAAGSKIVTVTYEQAP